MYYVSWFIVGFHRLRTGSHAGGLIGVLNWSFHRSSLFGFGFLFGIVISECLLDLFLSARCEFIVVQVGLLFRKTRVVKV